jgi:hypothetical protein
MNPDPNITRAEPGSIGKVFRKTLRVMVEA